MPTRTIDLNADVGESFGRWSLGDDAAVLRVVSSANVACGFHAGDPSAMRRTCELAVASGVMVGAHVGYPDLAGFGRRFLDMKPEELADAIVYQIGALMLVARKAGTRVRFVKPHGALYAAAVSHADQAQALVEAVASVDDSLPLVVPPRSIVRRLAEERDLAVVTEAFLDRAYLPNGQLVPRGQPGAVIEDETAVVDRALRLVHDRTVVAIDGTVIPIDAATLCTHGDTDGADRLLARVVAALVELGVEVRAFS